jgi:hypothetical protein
LLEALCVQGIVAGLGRFVVVPGWLYLRDHRRLIDRNMLLMLKDVLIARYCSCVSVWKNRDLLPSCGDPVDRDPIPKKFVISNWRSDPRGLSYPYWNFNRFHAPCLFIKYL